MELSSSVEGAMVKKVTVALYKRIIQNTHRYVEGKITQGATVSPYTCENNTPQKDGSELYKR